MMPDDRLRIELEALERSVPDDVLPLTLPTGRPTWVRSIATGGLMVAAVIVAAIGVRYLLDHRPGATEPGVLEWSVVQFSDSGVLDSITSLDGRLVLAGADADGPAVWISQDGFAWGRSKVVINNQANRDAEFLSMGIVSGHGDELIALGHRRISDGNTVNWEAALWTSRDGGRNWEDAPEGPVPAGTLDVVAIDDGYVALGQGPNGLPAVWTSPSGIDWTLVADASAFGEASVEALAVRDGQIVAVGARLTQTGPGMAMAWRSSDGVQWEPIVLSGDDSGNATDVIAADSGFVAVGSQIGAVTGAVAWQSTDGITWRTVVLNEGGDIGAGSVATLGDQFVAIGGRLLEMTTGRTAWSILSPSGRGIPLDLDGDVRGLAGYGDRFVGIGAADCGLVDQCAALLFFGLPVGTPWPERLGMP